MATKLYLPRIAQTTPISPAISTGWLTAPALIRANAKTVIGSDALGTITVTELTSAINNICAAQYIAPLKAGQTITGAQAIQFVCQFQESGSNNNMNSAFGIRILDSTGTIVRKVLLAPTAEAVEFVVTPTVHTNRNNTATSAAGNYTTVDGDYLVIEIGAGGDPSGSNPHTYSLRLGNSGATFLTANDTGTSSTDPNSPWVQLADTLILEPSMTTPAISSGAVLYTGTLDAASLQTLTGAFISAGGSRYAMSVLPDAVTLTPPAISSGTRFAPTVSPQAVTLTGGFRASAASLNPPLVTQTINLQTTIGFLISGGALYPPSLVYSFQNILAGQWRQEIITGANGLTDTFFLSATPLPPSLFIFINGFDYTDYILTGSTLTFAIPPSLGDIIVAKYNVGFGSWRRDVVPGANGSAVDFPINARPITNSLLVFVNGFLERDYTLVGQTITLGVPPLTGDHIAACYFS